MLKLVDLFGVPSDFRTGIVVTYDGQIVTSFGERTGVIIGGPAGNSILALDEDGNRQPIGYTTGDGRILDTEHQETPFLIGGSSGQEVIYRKYLPPQ
jgi:hypothetical protein